ncbi:MAG: crotonase/enoyl-CoA hydratase family protein [Polyangiales bacterium]
MTEILRYECSDSVATITMDDGKVNSISLAMLAELNRGLDRAEQDDAVAVITGRNGVFSGGFDLETFKQGGEPLHQMLRGGADLVSRVLSFPRPVVIACSGHAVAMGAFLAMSGDMRIGVAGDFKVLCNEVAIGLTVPRALIEISRSRLTPSHFNRALVTAETYSPEGAVEAGFLDRIVPVAELANEAASAARRLATLNARAHAQTKLLVRERALEAIRAGTASELGSYEIFLDTIGAALKVKR